MVTIWLLDEYILRHAKTVIVIYQNYAQHNDKFQREMKICNVIY